VAETLRTYGAEVLMLLSRKAIDRQGARVAGAVELEFLPAMGAPSGVSLLWIAFGASLAVSVGLSVRILRRFGAQAVLGMGGFASAPPIAAAHLMGIPSVIHESNAVAGRANRLASRWASAIAVGMVECAKQFPLSKTHVTGTPVRSGLRRWESQQARQSLGLRRGLFTVLVMGGSQGARAINQAVIEALPRLAVETQFFHLCGGGADVELLRAAYARHGVVARVEPFWQAMDLAYSAADVVVSRAGASSLAEIAHYGLPSVLVPYPQAAGAHQQRNAEAAVNAGASQMILQERLTGQTLACVLGELWCNEQLREAMRTAAQRRAAGDASGQLARLLYRAAGIEVGAAELAVRATQSERRLELSRTL
jgi:UDP-N-acetylglucosamine--N-acetylmuramyl-(pentapeptide) pyrophosphoryl-undecaprenol N-acetylglucosamine transferase